MDLRLAEKDKRHQLRVSIEGEEIVLESDVNGSVRFRVEGKTLVIEKAPGGESPLDGTLGKKPDRDLFGKIAEEQAERKRRQLEEFGGKVKEAAEDPEPPDSIFGRD